ncbi:hypothetical protein FOZ63_001159, partial [Perkinsus olseni]
ERAVNNNIQEHEGGWIKMRKIASEDVSNNYADTRIYQDGETGNFPNSSPTKAGR